MHTAVSLYAGGATLGFQQAGYAIRLAIDKDAAAVETLRLNFPELPVWQANIRTLARADIQSALGDDDLDVLVGGPPSWKTGGAIYLELLAGLRPRWLLFETAESVLSADKGRALYDLSRALIEIGYRIRVHKVYAEAYGLPQRRRRVLIVGTTTVVPFTLPDPTHLPQATLFDPATLTIMDAIADMPPPATHPDADPPLGDHWTPPLSAKLAQTARLIGPGQGLKDLPDYQPQLRRGLNGRITSNGRPYLKSGEAPAGLRRPHPDQPAPTITATRNLLHPLEDRLLTLRECARLQSFPDGYQFAGPPHRRLALIAGAIPPLIARVFAAHLRQYMDERAIATGGDLLGYYLTTARTLSASLRRTAGALDRLRLEHHPHT